MKFTKETSLHKNFQMNNNSSYCTYDVISCLLLPYMWHCETCSTLLRAMAWHPSLTGHCTTQCLSNFIYFSVQFLSFYIISFRLNDTFVVLFNTLRSRQDGHHLADNIFKQFFFNENVQISIKINMKSSLVEAMAKCWTGEKTLSEPKMTQFNDAHTRHVDTMS